jgi:hypothetical protein
MRLSFAFLDAANPNPLANRDFNVTGDSPGFTGTLATSPFEKQFQRLEVPAGTARLRVNFASGGSGLVTGLMLIDDLSVRKSLPLITDIIPDVNGINLTWNSMPTKTYSVLFTDNLGPTTVWTPLATGFASGGLTTTYTDSATHTSMGGFYRVVQE